MAPRELAAAVATVAAVAAAVAAAEAVAAAAAAATEAGAAWTLPQRTQKALRERGSKCLKKLRSDDPDANHLITNRPHTQLRFASQANDHAHRLRDNDLESQFCDI